MARSQIKSMRHGFQQASEEYVLSSLHSKDNHAHYVVLRL